MEAGDEWNCIHNLHSRMVRHTGVSKKNIIIIDIFKL